MMGDDIGAQAPAPAPAKPAAPADDLLLLDMGGPTPAPPAAPAAPSAPAMGGDLLGGLMGGAPAAPASTPLLGPLQVSTAQVGQMWGSLATERKVSLQTS